MRKVQKQVQTERGLLWVEAEYESEKICKEDGYSYAFYSKECGKLYSKCLDDIGHRHVFAIVKR